MTSRLILTAAGALALAACAAAPEPAAPPAAMDPSPTTCGAARYQEFVGRSRADLPPPAAGEMRREACTTCAVTMDYKPQRMTIVFDEATNVIREIKCG